MGIIGADIVLKTLAEEGVDVIFGYPGANTLPLNDRLADSPIRHYLMRHEQGAAHAADGYARATGKVGVCLATSGPGATNLVTGIATAYMDSTPMVAITAQVNSDLWGRDAFQETDIIGITMPITKHSFMVRDVNQLAASLRQAFQLASTGRTGPVLVDIPRDILSAACGEQPKRIPAAPPKRIEHPEQLERIAQALNRSERPVIIIGGGVKLGDACDLATAFVQTARVPFVSTMMGLGSVAYQNGFNLGFIGMHGNELANRTVHQADFILALGTRFTERSTSVIEEFAPLATVAQIDIDSTSIGKNIKVDLPYEGEIQDALAALIPLIAPREREEWMGRIAAEREQQEAKLKDGGCGQAGNLIRKIQAAMSRETIVVPDVGLNQIWTVRTWQSHSPRSLLTSGGMGTMGFSVPAAIGAKVGAPDRDVVVICGDGGFYMNIQELATISSYRIAFHDERTGRHGRSDGRGKGFRHPGGAGRRGRRPGGGDCPDERRRRPLHGGGDGRSEQLRLSDYPPGMFEYGDDLREVGDRRKKERKRDMAIEERTISMLVNNQPGVLSRIAGVFSSRGYNIRSLCVAETSNPEVSRITLTSRAESDFTEKIKKQLDKLVDIISVTDFTGAPAVQRELMLISLRLTVENRREILRAIDLFGCRVVAMSEDYLIMEITANKDKTAAILKYFEPFGVEEMNRTGAIAVFRQKREG
jgi:acetolactate synthase-1/2/3 large subunit